jgi:DNA excision repair protein ERCC-3
MKGSNPFKRANYMNDKIVIQFGPVTCTVLNPNEYIDDILNTELSYRPEGYFFSPRYQAGGWDGYSRLFSVAKHCFRSGLLNQAVEKLQSEGYDVEVKGFPSPKPFIQRSSTYELRPYQKQAVESICKERFGLIKAPMRSGKTMLFMAAVDSERLFPAVFFCRSIDLTIQTVNRIKEFLPSITVGMIGDGSLEIGEVTVITIQSAFSAYDKRYESSSKNEKLEKPVEDKKLVKTLINNARVVFYDEVQHLVSRTSKFILDKCVNACMKIGLSATPFSGKEEDILVRGGIGPVIEEIGWSELIREGFVLRPTIYMYKLPKMVVDGNYQSIYKRAVVDNMFLTALVKKIVRALVASGKSVVVQTELISHTKLLAEELGCPMLTGKDDSGYRTQTIDDLNSKKILCLVSTLFEEGLDLPNLDYTINVAGGLSSISTLQRMRSLTASEGKQSCGIIDFYHQCKYLKRHSMVRKKLYTQEPEFKFTMRDASKLSLEELNGNS